MRIQKFLVSAVLMSGVVFAGDDENNDGRRTPVNLCADFETPQTGGMRRTVSQNGGLDEAWDPCSFDIDDNLGPVRKTSTISNSFENDSLTGVGSKPNPLERLVELLRQAVALDPVGTKKILDSFLPPLTLFGRTPKGALILNLDVAYAQLANVRILRELTGATWDAKRPLTPKVKNMQVLRFPHPGHGRIKGQGRLVLGDLTQQKNGQQKCLEDKK